MTAPKKTARGTARMQEHGYHPVQLWLSPTINEQLKAAAKRNGQPKSKYALAAILEKLITDGTNQA
jgi:hypothetical protein